MKLRICVVGLGIGFVLAALGVDVYVQPGKFTVACLALNVLAQFNRSYDREGGQ